MIYLHRPELELWCVLRAAHPGGRITTICADSLPYARVNVSTDDPGPLCCRACAGELSAGTPGAATVALEAIDEWADSDEPALELTAIRRGLAR